MSAEAPDTTRPFTLTVARALPWLALAALWMIITTYRGLYHDAVLYSLQAIARLRPELYSGDIFLRYGSQDTFSLFSPVYSVLVGWLGVESAAAWMTFTALLALQATAWFLIRRLVPATPALMGLGFLIALPNSFGPNGIFHVVEAFLTPRMLAEALALGAILAILGGRRLLAAALLAASASVHPLMAAPAVLIVAFVALPANRRWYLPAAAGLGLVALAVVGSLPAIDAFRVDAEWREFLDTHAAYLFAAHWRLIDWMQVCATFLTLLLGARFLAEPVARLVCSAVLFTALLGMAIMLIGADWLQIALVVQGQGYRWLWPATLLALLVFPALGAQLWRLSVWGRAALFALASLWVARNEPFAPMVAVVAVIVVVIAIRDPLAPAYRRLVLVGTVSMLAVTACFSLADRLMTFMSAYEQSFAPVLVDRLRALFLGGLVPALLLLAVFGLARVPTRRITNGAVALTLLAACVALVPVSYAVWGRRDFEPRVHAAFASWRALIPPRSEVVWIEAPESVWLLLERPSYFSVQQSATGVFSRAAALELMAREGQLVSFMKGNDLRLDLAFVDGKRRAERPAAHTLAEVCNSIDAEFVVARAAFQGAVFAAAPAGVSPYHRALRLYRCDPPPI